MSQLRTRLLLLAIACTIVCTLSAQNSVTYKVIKAGGKVLSASTNRQIRTGDLVRSTDKLSFASTDSYLHVASSTGRKTIRHVPDNSPREMQQLMQAFLSPDRKQRSSRGGGAEGLEKLIHEMSYDTLLVLGKGRVSMDSVGKTLLKPAGVKAAYSTSTGKVEKQISDNTGFNLGKEFLFADLAVPYPKVSIMYMEDLNEPVFAPMQILGSFLPIYVDEVALRTELQWLIDSSRAGGLSNPKILKEVSSYLGAEYAPAITENVQDWLRGQSLLK